MLNLQLLSDVHGRWDKAQAHPQAQVILALGDITEGVEGIEWLAQLGKPVIYVPGNHEYYGGDLGTRLDELKKRAQGTSVTVADRQTITAGGVRFLCATLWTDHNSLDSDLMAHSLKSLNDYRNIKAVLWHADYDNQKKYEALLEEFESIWPQHKGLFPEKPEKMNPLVGLALHQQALDYLVDELAKPWPGKTIVLTHHAPSMHSLLFAGYFTTVDVRKFATVLGRKAKPHKIGAYASSLEYLFTNHKIEMWMHGHLHEGLRYTINGTDVVTNPTGYMDSQNTRYHPAMLIRSEDRLRHAKLLCLTIYQSLLYQSELSALVKKCIMHDEKVSRSLFETIDDVICFAKLYNHSISPLLQQQPRDRNRPDYLLDPINIQRILGIHPEAAQGMDITHRLRFLHEMLNRITANERKSKEWLMSAQAIPELENWTVEGDI